VTGPEQTTIPGTDPPHRKRQSVFDKAVTGDLVIARDLEDVSIVAIEMVRDGVTAEEIVERWKDLGIVGRTKPHVSVWEMRPGFYYRRRDSR